jgi:hypothetical protein
MHVGEDVWVPGILPSFLRGFLDMAVPLQDKIAYGVAGTAVLLFAVKQTDVIDFFPSTTSVDGVPIDTASSGSMWPYIVAIIIILVLVAYTSREVLG